MNTYSDTDVHIPSLSEAIHWVYLLHRFHRILYLIPFSQPH